MSRTQTRRASSNYLRKSDVSLGFFWYYELDAVVDLVVERVGKPKGKFAGFFRIGNELFVRSTLPYSTAAAWFVEGWKHGKYGCTLLGCCMSPYAESLGPSGSLQ